MLYEVEKLFAKHDSVSNKKNQLITSQNYILGVLIFIHIDLSFFL